MSKTLEVQIEKLYQRAGRWLPNLHSVIVAYDSRGYTVEVMTVDINDNIFTHSASAPVLADAEARAINGAAPDAPPF